MTPPIPLAAAFPVFSEDDWRAAVSRIRRGAVHSPNDPGVGATVARPLFPRHRHSVGIAGRSAAQPWRVIQRVDVTDAGSAARAIGEDIAGGATGAEVAFAGSGHPLGGRLPEDAAPALARTLGNTLPDNFQLRIDDGGTATVADAFIELAAARKAELVLAFDPITASAARGASASNGISARLNARAKAFDAHGVDGAVAVADGRLWHAGGATEVQELAATFASFVEYARLLATPGKISVSLAADSDQFRTIAKFRAMRLLLARLAEVAGLTSPPPLIHAETAWRSISARDPEMNILRGMSAAFGAAIGGADSITVLPFDAVVGGGDSHARRLARNTQTILTEEAHLYRVADPGAGSGAIETLTATFAEEAWKRFQAIENEGGILTTIAAGLLLREIAEAREARLVSVASCDIKMVGVNAYTAEDTAPTPPPAAQHATMLTFTRLSETFEAAK